MEKFDFSGWATRTNMKCTDGLTIMKDAFKNNNGQKVPLVWNHKHDDPNEVLGHAFLENREEGVYARCKFNDTENGRTAKLLVEHGDINSLSIWANQIKKKLSNVVHGNIREVSLVLAGANPGAFIDAVISHGDDSDSEAIIYTGELLELYHSDKENEIVNNENVEDQNNDEAIVSHADDNSKKNSSESNEDKTIAEIFDTLNEEQKTVVYAMIGQALEKVASEEDNKEEKEMKHNVFDKETDTTNNGVLSHSDQSEILRIAKSNSCGSLRDAIETYVEGNDTLAHGIDDIETLFPEFKDVRPGAPELIERDQGWVSEVMRRVHKSPISRIRTRQADVRGTDLRAYGYKKGAKKNVPGNIKLLKRTTDPQTVYRKDALHRDDIIDITDFDVVEYQYDLMKKNLNEELALAIMIGDGRDVGDDNKISEEHIRPIWLDDDLYTIHADVDIEAARAELQGTDTAVHFGENYVYAEAIITAALYAREKYKGSGSLDFYCTPHLLNVMLLARDMNGRRIYSSKADLVAALNVNNIYTAEQFEGKERTTEEGDKKKLLGLFVNLNDYHVGSTKGGEITRFNQFDIDFNQEKYLIETRLSGALTRVYSAIALEEPVATNPGA